MFYILENQPEELSGYDYAPGIKEMYTWMEFKADCEDTPYAHAGVIYRGTDAWMFWKIAHKTLAGWKDLKQNVVPALNEYFKKLGATQVCCFSTVLDDVDFDKMTAFMGFTPIRFATQEVK